MNPVQRLARAPRIKDLFYHRLNSKR